MTKRAGVSAIDRLRAELGELDNSLTALISISLVKRWSNDGPVVVVTAPEYYFTTPSEDQRRRQLALRQRYLDWYERFSLLYPNPPDDLHERIAAAHEEVLKWIDLDRNYTIGPDLEANALASQQAWVPFHELLDLLDQDAQIVVVPDTNALLVAPDPRAYSAITEFAEYEFVLLPTVLEELDQLKLRPSLGDKAARIIRRIKGWRTQGSMDTGVTYHRTITIRMVPREPQFDSLPHWLDPTHKDDRIIASVLELQRQHPSAPVWLVTGDINLQNKAEHARLNHAEPPPANKRKERPDPHQEIETLDSAAVWFPESEALADGFDDSPLVFGAVPLVYLRVVPRVKQAPLSRAEALRVAQATAFRPLGVLRHQGAAELNRYGAIRYAGSRNPFTGVMLWSASQLFRNREIWSVASSLPCTEGSYLPINEVEAALHAGLTAHLHVAREELGLGCPLLVEAGAVGVTGFDLRSGGFLRSFGKIHDDIVHRGELMTFGTEDVERALLRIFEEFFDAVGRQRPVGFGGLPADCTEP